MAAKELFRSLGAGEIFGGKAELSKITDDGPLTLSDIIHESVLEITKDGTEGAAATGIKRTGGGMSCNKPLLHRSGACLLQFVLGEHKDSCCQQTFHLHPSGSKLSLGFDLMKSQSFFRTRRIIFH